MEKTISTNGQPVFYTSTGEGDPVVLLHGLAEDGSIWEAQTSFLSSAYKLIVPDLPGSGLSPLPSETTMETLAGAVKAILEAEGIEQTVMIGHSMGGYATLAFAELYASQLKAFGLFHSTAFADNEEKKVVRKKNIEFISSHGTLEFLKQATPALFGNRFKDEHPENVQELIEKYRNFNPLSLVAYNEAMMQRPDRRHVLVNAGCPVLFVIGKEDNTIPFEQSMQLTHLPDIAYIHILESGHMGLMEEQERSNLLLKKFLEDVYIR